VDLDDPTPLYVQIVQGLRRALARGEVVVGQKLPSVRQLAGDLGINLNTVARAYRQLEEEGFVRVRQGRGVRVVRTSSAGSTAAAEARLVQALDLAFEEATVGGLERDVMERVARSSLDRLGGSADTAPQREGQSTSSGGGNRPDNRRGGAG
jgi:GntR family transcriptional regulator